MSINGNGFVECTECGSAISANENFCSNCGTKKIVPEKKTVAKKKFCESCDEPADFYTTECSSCGGSVFSHKKPENFDDSKLIAEPSGQDSFRAIRPEETAKSYGFDWRSHSSVIIGALVIAVVLFTLLILSSVFKNTASTEEIILSGGGELQARICSTDDRQTATNLIRENKDPNLEFKKDEGLGFAIYDEVKRVCKILLAEDTYLVTAIAEIQKQKRIEDARLEKERIATEKLRAKYEPLLEQWNERAREAGLGDLSDYFSATSSAESLITAGAQYSLTGASREVQSASCWPTQYSLWSQGEPGGWWSCYINFLGGGDSYSVEFSGGSWSGNADAGSRAGRELNWKIPQGLLDWMDSR
jgi:hypothetical protein